MKISLIWAMSDDRVIGINNQLPWKLSADMRWFRRHTLGKPIVMGRKTFESFGAKPLPERNNIIITRDRGYQAEGAQVVFSLEDALAATGAGPADEIMIIGGAALYQQMLPRADRLYLTQVHGFFAGDTWFPAFDQGEWQQVEKHDFDADENAPWPVSFYILDRKKKLFPDSELCIG